MSNVHLIAHVQYNADTDEYTTTTNEDIEEIPASLTPTCTGGSKTLTKTLMIFPDSGASICLASPKHIKELGVST